VTFVLYIRATCPTHLILYLITVIILATSVRCTVCSLLPDTNLNALLSDTQPAGVTVTTNTHKMSALQNFSSVYLILKLLDYTCDTKQMVAGFCEYVLYLLEIPDVSGEPASTFKG